MNTEIDAERVAALATLSPEERASLEESALSPEEEAALKSIAADGDDDDDDDDDKKDDGEDGDSTVATAKATDDAATATDADPVIEDKEKSPEFKPRYQVAMPDDFDEQVKSVDDREAALLEKFKLGELEADDFVVENRKLSNERRELDTLRTKAEIAREMGAQTAEQEWNFTVTNFMRKVKRDEGIDYATDEAKGTDLDTFVKVLANNPANADKDYDWFLIEAHKRAKVLHGITEQKKETPAAKTRKPPTDKLPATLAQVPGGDGPGDISGDEFSELDALDGLEYERALASMSKEKRDRYLKAA